MTCFKFILLILIGPVTFLADFVVGLQVEGILRGSLAQERSFVYHVAILAKPNKTNIQNLTGSGAIIAQNLILTAAQNFINNDGDLREYQYSIKANTTNWREIEGIEVLIDVIYLPSGAIDYFDDIAVAKLESNLSLAHSPYISALRIPSPDESFIEAHGLVTGYGFNWIVMTDSSQSTFQRRFSGGTDDKLRFAKVQITEHDMCSIIEPMIDTDKQFCGVMKPRNNIHSAGICDNDSGSPLAIKSKIIGIAGSAHFDCDDTSIGSAYTKVSYYAPFIRSIIDNKPLPDVLVRHNRIHSYNLAAAAA